LRRRVEEKPEYRPLFAARVAAMEKAMREGPALSAESYPDECWTFDNANALAAMQLSDVLDGTDHADFLRAWVRTAKTRLVDAKSGMLVSSFRRDGTPLDGSEGSSIWMAAHALSVVDADFARDQYDRARKELN